MHHRPRLKTLLNQHENVPAVVVGSSPKLSSFRFEKFSGVVIGVGDSPLRGLGLFKTDYWITANSYWPRPWCHRDADAINSVAPRVMILGSTAFAYQDLSHISDIKKRIAEYVTVPTLLFNQQEDTKHSHLVEFESIQAVVAEKFGCEQRYSSGSSVAVHGLALALLLGCSPIYLIGIDLPFWVHDYQYFRPHGWRQKRKQFGSLGPYCDEFTIPEFRSRLVNFGSVQHDLQQARARFLKWFGMPVRSDFGLARVSLLSDFEHLARLAHGKTGRVGVFVNDSQSALTGARGIGTTSDYLV